MASAKLNQAPQQQAYHGHNSTIPSTHPFNHQFITAKSPSSNQSPAAPSSSPAINQQIPCLQLNSQTSNHGNSTIMAAPLHQFHKSPSINSTPNPKLQTARAFAIHHHHGQRGEQTEKEKKKKRKDAAQISKEPEPVLSESRSNAAATSTDQHRRSSMTRAIP
jgi:hypothetical protein